MMLVLFILVLSTGAYVLWSWASSTSERGTSVGQMALDIDVVGVDGSRFILSEHRGKVVILEFMTTWCGYCEAQTDVLEELSRNYDVIIASIDVDPNMNDAGLASWAEDEEIGWFVGHSPNAGLAYEVSGVPTVLVIEDEGFITYRGYYTEIDQFVSLIRQLQG